jgi:site-specific recombinase XerD
MKRNSFSVLFFIRKTRLLKNGDAPISLRITVNGQRAEIQIPRSIPVKKWDCKRGCAKGNERAEMELNHFLDTLRAKVLKIHRQLEMDNELITADVIKHLYHGTDAANQKMLLGVFEEHNKKCRALIDKEFALGTVLRYERTVTYLREFMQREYRINDIPLDKITDSFLRNFEFFVKSEKNCQQNMAIKYLKNIKKITRFAIANNWIKTDPFISIKFQETKTEPEFLVEEEINLILSKDFKIERLNIIRDIFCFCCFTGLAFKDIKFLSKEHIVCDKGSYWIRKKREKTQNMCNIPLLEIPLALIQKYSSHPKCKGKNTLFPVPTNERMNAYLKEIADICGIDKNLTTHCARHSFATLTLTNNVSMANVAKMLGHSDLRMTQHYARVLDVSIMRDMENVEKALTLKKQAV